MSNLRNNIVLKGAILTILLMITGVFVAVATVDDRLEASWTEGEIEVCASNLMVDKYYQIRYYQPGTLPEGELSNSDLWSDESNADNTGLIGPYAAATNTNGFYNGTKFKSNEFTCPLEAPAIDWYEGDWTIVLMKGGSTKSDPTTYANSFRTSCNVHYIPEFQTIALPIAAILGIMFILQSRKRKEN
jgi:hypothetical protein